MKSVSRSIGLINLNVLQYVLCQITRFSHTSGKFAAKPRIFSTEDANEWQSQEKKDGLVFKNLFQESSFP